MASDRSRSVAPPARWRTPEELVAIGVERSRLVLVNEAHDGDRRCVRTRRDGLRIVASAHAAGVRHLAMEALHPHRLAELANRTRRPPDVEGGYLAQPEMRELIADSLSRGWTLIAYEADFLNLPPGLEPFSDEETNWREDEQARNIATALRGLPAAAALLVWCGNHHLAKHGTDEWRPMAVRLLERCGTDPFAIDQLPSVQFDRDTAAAGEPWATAFAGALAERGGTAGFLAADAPPEWPWPDLADAFLLSTDNAMS